jgi:hypothetical protein
MSAVRATVRSGRLVVDQPTDFPEGAQVELFVVDAGDDLDEAERVELDAAIDAAAESVARGEAIDAEEVLRRLGAVGDL